MPSRIEILQAVRLRSRATVADVVAATGGTDPQPVAAELAALTDAGLCAVVGTRHRLTPAGRQALDADLDRERAALDGVALTAAYERFEPLNGAFKQLVTDWQLKDGQVPNDHQDATYDAAVVGRLGALHARVMPLLDALTGLVPRLTPYPRRFATALERVRAGEQAWLARPLIDSYHTVWFELHEELLGLAGRSRVAEAAAGRDA